MAFSPRWQSDTLQTLLMIWLSGAQERIGYGTNPFVSWVDAPPPPHVTALDNFFLTRNIITPRSIITDVEKNFYLLKASGLKVEQTHVELFYGAEDFQRAKEWLEDLPSHCKKVLLGIGSLEPNKKYPVAKYLIALRELAKKNLVFVIVGGKSELKDAEFLEKNLPLGKVLNFVGKTTLRETEAIASQADFYIGNDTCVMHMAAAAKIPCIVLYREAMDKDNILPGVFSMARRFPPYQTKAVILRPQHQLDDCATSPPFFGFCMNRKEPHCITQITPQEIIAGFEKLEEMV